MKNLAKFVAIGTLLASATLAHASGGTGQINISGDTAAMTPTTFSTSVTSVSFDNNFNDDLIEAGSGSGIYNTNINNGTVEVIKNSFVQFTSTFNFTGGLSYSTTTLATPENLFTIVVGGTTYYFDVESFILTQGLNPSVYFYGTMDTTLDSGTGASNSYSLSPEVQQDGSFASELSNPPLSPTPEPSSLILLGTGLASAAGVLARKRKAVKA